MSARYMHSKDHVLRAAFGGFAGGLGMDEERRSKWVEGTSLFIGGDRSRGWACASPCRMEPPRPRLSAAPLDYDPVLDPIRGVRAPVTSERMEKWILENWEEYRRQEMNAGLGGLPVKKE